MHRERKEAPAEAGASLNVNNTYYSALFFLRMKRSTPKSTAAAQPVTIKTGIAESSPVSGVVISFSVEAASVETVVVSSEAAVVSVGAAVVSTGAAVVSAGAAVVSTGVSVVSAEVSVASVGFAVSV